MQASFGAVPSASPFGVCKTGMDGFLKDRAPQQRVEGEAGAAVGIPLEEEHMFFWTGELHDSPRQEAIAAASVSLEENRQHARQA